MSRPDNKENLMSLADQLLWWMEAYGNGFESLSSRLFWVDDFLGKQLLDEWRSAGAVGGSAVVVDAQPGGIVRITTDNDLNNTWFIDWADIRSLLVSKKASMEVRVKLTQTTNTVTRLSLRFDFNNSFYFEYNSGSSANWQIRSNDGGASAGLQDTGVATDTSYHVLRMECQTHGGSHVHFYIDGVETGNSPITTNIPDDAGDYLQPYLFILTLEDATKSVDIDYVVVRQER